jgi:HK97 family phage prohead protease
VIEKGAFSMPASLPMLFGHDQTQVIGVWDQITEGDQGLTVKGRLLSDDIERAKEVRAMVKAGAVTGLSIGFVTTKSTRNAKGRNISALDLHEISVVAVPCHPGAQITSLKSETTIPKEIQMEPEVKIETPAVVANDAPQADTKAFDAINARLDKMEAKSNRPGVQVVAADAPKAEVKAFGTYLRRGAVMDADEVKALTVADAANGGYLAPSENNPELLKLLREFSPLRQYAKVISTNAAEIIFPRRLTSTSAA